jgi:hypothetical protein
MGGIGSFLAPCKRGTRQGGNSMPEGYESPRVIDLGDFAKLTQTTTGVAQDHAQSSGTQ